MRKKHVRVSRALEIWLRQWKENRLCDLKALCGISGACSKMKIKPNIIQFLFVSFDCYTNLTFPVCLLFLLPEIPLGTVRSSFRIIKLSDLQSQLNCTTCDRFASHTWANNECEMFSLLSGSLCSVRSTLYLVVRSITFSTWIYWCQSCLY